MWLFCTAVAWPLCKRELGFVVRTSSQAGYSTSLHEEARSVPEMEAVGSPAGSGQLEACSCTLLRSNPGHWKCSEVAVMSLAGTAAELQLPGHKNKCSAASCKCSRWGSAGILLQQHRCWFAIWSDRRRPWALLLSALPPPASLKASSVFSGALLSTVSPAPLAKYWFFSVFLNTWNWTLLLHLWCSCSCDDLQKWDWVRLAEIMGKNKPFSRYIWRRVFVPESWLFFPTAPTFLQIYCPSTKTWPSLRWCDYI